MRVQYNDLMSKLGVGHILSPYETRPWFVYDEERGLTCSAEVRVGPGAEDVEAEIQFLHDEVDSRYEDEDSYGGPQQVFFMRFKPSRDNLWSAEFLLAKGQRLTNEIYNWGERGADFFCLFIGALQMEEIPDIEEMIDEHLTDRSSGGRGGRKGRVGKKGFKVQQKPMGIKP
ncbi:MAG: hypothetical protein ACRBDL_10220 [Alphaproteobacteria bacterium]